MDRLDYAWLHGSQGAGRRKPAGDNRTIIEVTDLTKRFGDITAVDSVSFQVATGEIFGLLGPNGAGKTTTIAIMCGLESADAGTVKIRGHDVADSPTEVRRMLGVVPQEISVYPRFTAWENLEYFGGLYGLRGRELQTRVAEVLEFVALTEYARKPVAGKFSGGMQRRLNLAAGLLHRPELLLLDEPTVGVDAQSRNYILDNIRSLNREHGTTILYTTHYMEEAEALCDRVAIMDRGGIVACDNVVTLVNSVSGTFFAVSLSRDHPGFGDALRSHAGVLEVAGRDNHYRITAASQKDGLAALQSAIAITGASLDSLAVSAPNLEQVFLQLTGKELRDEAA